MPYTDFTELLLKVQEKNLGQGLIASAQARMMLNQDAALRDTLAQYNKAKLDLEGKFLTTEEQLRQINESDLLQEGAVDLEKTAQTYASLMALNLQNQSELQNLVYSTQQRLTNIGTPEALNQVGLLSEHFKSKSMLLEKQQEIPFKKIELVSNLLNLNETKINFEKSQITLNELKSNLGVMERVAKVMNMESFDKKTGKRTNLWIDLVTKLGFNTDTGKLNSREELKKFYEFVNEVFDTPEDRPYKDKVIKAFDLMISERIKNYSPPRPVTDTKGIEKIVKDIEYTGELYGWLNTQSRNYAEMKHSPDYQATRDLYNEYAEQYIKELEESGHKLSDADKGKIKEFGSSKQVVERILNDENVPETKVLRTDNLPNTPKTALEYFYKTFVDKNNNEGYWKQLEIFKAKTNIPKVEHGKSYYDPNGKVQFDKNEVEINFPFVGARKFDLNAIMSDDAGFWNWYEVLMGKAKTYQQEVYEKLEAPNKPGSSTPETSYFETKGMP